MTTITFDEEIKIEKTHFKNVSEFLSNYKSHVDWDKVFTKEDVEAFNWNSKENFTTLSINSSLPWINDPEEDKIWK